MTSNSNNAKQPTRTPEELMDFADGALGAAGHEVTDPATRELLMQVARGEITGDQAVAKILEHYDAEPEAQQESGTTPGL